jgi:hypothetical protein
MRITRKFLRELPIGHKATYKDVEVKSFNNVGTACTEVSRIDRVKEFIIKRDFEKWELTIEVQPYGYRKRLQDASPNEQGSLGESDRT